MLRLLKNLFWFAAMVWMGCLLGQVVVPWLTACAPEDDYAAARLLLDDFAGEGDGLWFRHDTIDLDRVYRALEAKFPYAFTMHCRTLRDGSSELSLEVGNQAAQAQAETLAEGIVRSLQLDGMDAAMDQFDQELDILEDTVSELEEAVFEDEEEDREDGFDGEDEEDFFEIPCPTCGEDLVVDDEALAAGVVDCPVCGGKFALSFEDEDDGSEED